MTSRGFFAALAALVGALVAASVACGSEAGQESPVAGPRNDDADTATGTDGGADDNDAHVVVDASGDGDAALAQDARGDSGTIAPIACGTTVCRADQVCSAGKCAFACTGATVPGDYATVQEASDALAATGQDATICLGEKSSVEAQVFVRDPGNHGKKLTIVGLSANRSKIVGEVIWAGGWGVLEVRGVGFTGPGNGSAFEAPLWAHPGKLKFVASRFEGLTGLYAGGGSGTAEIAVDGCDFAVGQGYGVQANSSGNSASPAALKLTVENSYLHDCGAALSVSTSGTGTMNVRFVGNSVVGCGAGIDVGLTGGDGVSAGYTNNLITGANTAISVKGSAKVAHGRNALWGNTTNYAGTAADGVGYVKADCLLDKSGPAPTLGVGSPCRGAGDPATATSTDFYGTPRGTTIDIGAVEAF
jgi:hypothetical protein